jgi:hypothetical protein
MNTDQEPGDSYCTPGCPDDACRASRRCAWPRSGTAAFEVVARQVRDARDDERDWIDHHEAEEDGEVQIAWHRGALQSLEETLTLLGWALPITGQEQEK